MEEKPQLITPELEATPPASDKPKPKSKLLLYIGSAVIFFLIMVLSVGFYIFKEKSAESKRESVSKTGNINNENDNTYSNNLFGFSFNYPKRYQLTEAVGSNNEIISMSNPAAPYQESFDSNGQERKLNPNTIAIRVGYSTDKNKANISDSFENLAKEKEVVTGSNVDMKYTTTLKKTKINGYDAYHRITEQLRDIPTSIDYQQTYIFHQNGYYITFSSASALNSSEIVEFKKIIKSIKFFKPTEFYNEPYDILQGLWEKGTAKYSLKDIAFSYPKTFIIDKSENGESLVSFYSNGVNLPVSEYRKKGFDSYFHNQNQFWMHVSYAPIPMGTTLEAYLRKQYDIPMPVNGWGGTPPTTWKDFKPSSIPTEGSFVMTGYGVGNENIGYYFLHQGNIYSFELQAVGDLGAANPEAAKIIYDKIIKSIEFN